MKPPKIPPHFTRSFMQWWSPAPAPPRWDDVEDLGLPLPPPSRWDSTRRRVQSPKPVEILSKKSPEKLRLPQPTDLDLDTFLSNDDAEAVAWLFGLSSSSKTTTEETESPSRSRSRSRSGLRSFSFTARPADITDENDAVLDVSPFFLEAIPVVDLEDEER